MATLDRLFESSEKPLVVPRSSTFENISEDSAEIKDDSDVEEEPRVGSERSNKLNCLRNAIINSRTHSSQRLPTEQDLNESNPMETSHSYSNQTNEGLNNSSSTVIKN